MAQLTREIARELVREGGLDIIIPDVYTSIQDSAFKNDQLTRITIPDSVTSIGNNAFKYNKLTEVTIPDSVTSIGDYAFGYNDLTAVTIPDSVTSIADNTFKYNKLTEITLPNSVASIGDYAFGYNDLTAVTIPNSVTSIGNNAFKHNKLTEVIIPDSVTSIGEDAFDSNPLESINLSEAPRVTITSSDTSLTFGETAAINFALSESSTDFSVDDVTASGGTLSGFAGTGASYTATFTPTPNSTTDGVVSVAAGAFTDAAGNASTGDESVTMTVNTVRPVVTNPPTDNTPAPPTNNTPAAGGAANTNGINMALLTRQWTQLLGSSEYDSGSSISIADDGSIYITGSTNGDLDGQTNSGEDDVFISKFNSDGSKQWTQLLGGSDSDSGNSITTADDGSIYITGSTRGDLDGQTNSGSSDVFISKFNSDGSKQWTQLLGSSQYDSGYSISTTDDESIYITGYTAGNLDGQNSRSASDIFISKFNSDGSRQWTQLLGSHDYESGYSISTTDDGSIYITGYTKGDLDGQTNSGHTDAFISKFHSDGSKQWTQLLGSSELDYGNSISIADDGSIYITGYTLGDLDGQTNSGGSDVFISKFNNDGSKQWTQLLGSSDYESGYSISTTDDGSIYITGYTKGDLDGQTNSGGNDVFITKFSSDGSKQWTQLLGSSRYDDGNSISIADDGSIYITGSTGGDLDGQTNSGISDVFISKFGLNDSPVVLSVSTSTFDENLTGGSAVATLSTSDPDSGDTHAYSLVTGDGDADNSAFTIDGDQLKIVGSPDYETKSSYSIRVQTKDSGGLTFEKSFTLTVNDLEEIDYDFNGDDSVTIEEDAVIGLRSMFGTFPGDALTSNVLNDESSKSLVQVQQEMSGYFQDSTLDRDADGMISPLTDGIQLIEEMQAMIQDNSSESIVA